MANLGDGTWTYTHKQDGILESNHWAIMHYPAPLAALNGEDATRGRILVSMLEPQETVHELMPWYDVLRPAKPVVLTGTPAGIPLYYWIVWVDEKGGMSKPSPVYRDVTVDNFKEK